MMAAVERLERLANIADPHGDAGRILPPAPNLAASPAALVALAIADCMEREFLKPKQQLRVLAAIDAARRSLHYGDGVVRIRDREPNAQAQARADAAEALRLILQSGPASRVIR
jgi:hypothetical protein